MTTPADIERRHGQIRAMHAVVEDAATRGDPARLVPMLSVLEARYVIGGHEQPARLEVGEHWRAYFAP